MLVLSRTGSFGESRSRPAHQESGRGGSERHTGGATHTRRRARPSGSRGAREMPSSRPVSARRPGHDIPEKIVVRCVPAARPPLRLRAAAVPCLRVSPPPEGALPLLTPAARRARSCRCRSYLQPRTINEAKSRARVALHEVAVPCAVARANWLASAQGGPPCYCAQAPPRPVPVAARCLAA